MNLELASVAIRPAILPAQLNAQSAIQPWEDVSPAHPIQFVLSVQLDTITQEQQEVQHAPSVHHNAKSAHQTQSVPVAQSAIS